MVEIESLNGKLGFKSFEIEEVKVKNLRKGKNIK